MRKRKMATVTIYLDSRFSGEKESPFKAVIVQGRKSAMISLGLKAYPHQWDPDTCKVKEEHPNHRLLNSILAGKKYTIEAEILRLEMSGKLDSMSIMEIRDAADLALHPGKEISRGKEKTFLFRYERFMSLKTRKNTINGYKWALNRLKEFDPQLSKRSFEDIGVDYINDFRAFLGKTVCANTCNVSMRYIRAVFRDAIKAGITTAYPFSDVKMKRQQTRKKALTPEQMRMLASCECRGNQEEYRDMFLLMFYLRGVNIGDLLQAEKSSIVNERFEYRRSKVGTLFSIKLEPEALALIEKYGGDKFLLSPLDHYKDYTDYLHHLNYGLKTIGAPRGKRDKIAGEGLFPGLSTNWARHTWASCGLNIDIPVEVISRGLGHSGALSVTQIYMDFDMKKVDEANRQIIDFVLYGKDYRRK